MQPDSSGADNMTFPNASSSSSSPLFLFEERNRAVLEGKVAYHSLLWKPLFLVGSGFVIFGLLVIAVAISSQIHLFRLQFSGVVSSGVITDSYISTHTTHAGPVTDYNLRYSFAGQGGQSYTGNAVVSQAQFLPVNTKVSVRYLEADPSVSQLIKGVFDDPSNDWLTVEGGTLFLCSGPLIAMLIGLFLIRWALQMRKLRRGRVVEAKVISTVVVKGVRDSQILKVEYSFISPLSGAVILKKVSRNLSRAVTKSERLGVPKEGEAVRVIYLNDRQFALL